jgi:PAS domain S-box-containing protein
MSQSRDRGPSLRGDALSADDRAFRMLVDSVVDYGICMLDPAGRVASWNQGAAAITGYVADQVLGRPVSMLYPSVSVRRGQPEADLASAERDGRWEALGWRVVQGGDRIWAHVAITAMRDDGGRLVGFAHVMRDMTQQRRAEKSLRQSEARLRELAETIHEVFWIARPDFSEYLYISPAYEEIWGRPLEGLLEDAQAFIEAVHPDDREAVLDQVAILRAGASTNVEYRIIRPDGAQRWLRMRGYPVHEAGELVRIVGVTEDVTERREREDAQRFLGEASRTLASSLDYEETLSRVARLAVPRVADWCAVDVLEDGQIRRLAVAHSDPAMEDLAWQVARRFPPDPDAERGVARVLRTGEPEFVPDVTPELLRLVTRDAEHLRILEYVGIRSVMIVPMVAHERVLGVIVLIASDSGRRFDEQDLGFAQDLAARAALAVDNAHLFAETERQAREEAALREATQALARSFTVQEVIGRIAEAALIAVGADGAFVERIDSEGRRAVVAATAGTLAPAPGASVALAGSLTRQVLERRRPTVLASLTEAGAGLSGRLTETCSDCSVVAVPLLDGSDAIGALIMVRDPAGGRFRDDEVARAISFADLASLAFRKVNLLEESERRREELERLMVSRARLLRGFSHDVKNPLGAADGYMQLFEDGILGDITEAQQGSVGRARRALASALKLIEDLVDLARAEAGQIEIRPEPVDVREVAREMTEEYRAQAEARGLAITCELPDRFPLIVSDSARIRQVLGNLISNAVKYTPSGTVHVATALQARADSGTCAVVAVSDTGPGIPKDKEHLLFQEFARLDPAAAPGAGLGLAISRRVARALGGDVTYDSAAGGGATFRLWLPNKPADAGAREAQQ